MKTVTEGEREKEREWERERERSTVREKDQASWSYELMKCHWTRRESGTWHVERGTHDVKQTEMQMSREKLFDDNIMTDIIM